MFVEEIGVGGTFMQEDLSPLQCYILDAGRDTLYVWHGGVAGYSTMALCTRICKKYIAAIQLLNAPVTNSSAPPSTEYLLRLPDSPIKVVHIRSGQETEDFIWNFVAWHSDFIALKNAEENRQPLQVEFTPSNVPEDEDEDARIGEDGKVKQVVEKPKYSTTVEYKRNKEVRATTSLETGKTVADFRTIKLKQASNMPTGDINDDISDISDDVDDNNTTNDEGSVISWIKSLFSGDANKSDEEHHERLINSDHGLSTPTAASSGMFCSIRCFV